VSYLAAEPMVFATDMAAALAFYQAALGFRVVERFGDPVAFAVLHREGARFALRHVDAAVVDPDRAAREELLALSLVLSDRDALDAVHAHALAAGAVSRLAPVDRPWGARNAILSDPCGNLILLAA
jgi:uncharacterized glyoxalase superfamily protein PhnB